MEIRLAPDDTTSTPRFIRWTGGPVPLEDGDHVVGRDPDLALFIDSPTVSRRQALLRTSACGAGALNSIGLMSFKPPVFDERYLGRSK